MLSASISPEDAAPSDLFTRDDTDWLAHFPASTMEVAAAARNGDPPFKTDPFAANDTSSAALPLERRAIGGHTARSAAEADTTAPVDDLMADTVVNANGGLFGQIEADDNRVGWSRHVLAVAAVAAVMIGAVIAFWTIGRLMEPRRIGRARWPRARAPVRTAR